MDTVRAHINAAFLIARESIIVIAIPNAAHDIDEFLGALVTLSVRHMRFAIKLQRIIFIAAGHNIPRCAAT